MGRLGPLVATAACSLALLGCGDDDEQAATTGPPATATQTAPTAPTAPRTADEPPPAEEPPPPETIVDTFPEPPPEDRPGGAGDEQPARSLALLTASNGGIAPRVVRVPPFIAVRVELRAPDGGEYVLDFGAKRIRTTAEISSSSATFDGLRPGQRLVGRPLGRGNRVTIVASAEPGP